MLPSIGGVLLMGFVLRLGFALYLGGGIYQPDEGVYVTMARNLHERGVFGVGDVPTAERPPALPFLLAGIFGLLGPSVLLARIVHVLFSVAGIWALYRYASLVFGRQAGLMAAAIAAVYPFFVYWSGILMTETLATVLVTFALWRTQVLSEGEARMRDAVAAGLLWGLASLTRTQNLAFPVALAAWLIWKARLGLRKQVLVFLVLAFLPPMLWAARNWRQFGALTMDTHAGYTLLIRTMFYDQDNIDTGVARQALEQTEFYQKAEGLPAVERDRVFSREALNFIRENPGTYLYNSCRNFWQFWRFYPRMDKTVGVVDSAFVGGKRMYFALLSGLTEPLLILCGLAGLYLGWKRGLPVLLPGLFIVFTTGIHTLVIAQMRYRIPVMPLIIMLASYGMISLWEKARSR